MAAMPIATGSGIEINYESFGDPADPTLLLVNGLGGQMIRWRPDFCAAFVERGLRVVRFDNRDTGLSTHLDESVDMRAVREALAAGEPPPVPYLLSDMAADAVAVLDDLGVDRAHVLGVSMGGMIAQTVAIEHPDRVRSLISVMSTTGDPDVGGSTPEAYAALTGPPSRTREEYQQTAVDHAGVWGSPGLYEPGELRREAGESWDRGVDAAGVARQFAAVTASGSRSAGLAQLDVPTLVIHGTADTLILPTGGQRTAEVVPGAELLIIEGMGHDTARPLWPRLVDAVTAHITGSERDPRPEPSTR
jgi:pimeloyl-ACP methyl ester carboxylesterase